MAQAIDYIKTAKEFADAYGVARLDRVMTLAEGAESVPKTQPSPAKADTDAILQEVEAAGFQLNPWLKSLILTASVEIVRDAMAVVKKNEQWGTVRNREGLLVEAIRNQWKPNLSA